jgi:hypothetical protein
VYRKVIVIWILLLFQKQLCYAQDYTWWNTKHNWDGITPWHDYIITSPGFMGPNALPVPAIRNGIISKTSYFKAGVDNHFSKGDKTENLYLELFVPLFSPRVGLNVQLVPLEHYKMDTITRDLRRARNFSGEGYAVGDFYFGTQIQLVKNKKKLPDVLLNISFKTASGSKLSDARFTNAPGYSFDLSFGEKVYLSEAENKFLNLYAMVGFYVWQLHGNSQLQNDAFLYGLGVDFNTPKLEVKNSFGGYNGYLGNGDSPMLYRLIFRSKFDSQINYELGLQAGIQDFNYTSIRLAGILNLSKIKEQVLKRDK